MGKSRFLSQASFHRVASCKGGQCLPRRTSESGGAVKPLYAFFRTLKGTNGKRILDEHENDDDDRRRNIMRTIVEKESILVIIIIIGIDYNGSVATHYRFKSSAELYHI